MEFNKFWHLAKYLYSPFLASHTSAPATTFNSMYKTKINLLSFATLQIPGLALAIQNEDQKKETLSVRR